MKNRYLENFDNIVKIKIEGKNINNYIKRLLKARINIIKLIPIAAMITTTAITILSIIMFIN